MRSNPSLAAVPWLLAGVVLGGQPPTLEELAADVSLLKKLNPWAKVVSSVKAKADLRLRHESEWVDLNAGDYDRHRERIRFRAGLEIGLPHDFAVGMRLATGNTNDPISTNQTLGDSLANKSIQLDLAYASWRPLHDAASLTLYGGRFKNHFFHHKTMFDDDTNFDGLGQGFSLKAFEGATFFANAVQSPLKEFSKDGQDPWLLAFQGGGEVSRGIFSAKAAAGMWFFAGLEGVKPSQMTGLRASSRFNSLDAAGAYERNYDVFHILGELSVSAIDPMPAAIVGEYYKNTETGHQDQGFMFGFRLGKNKKAGDLYGGYEYRLIEADATYDIFPDSDFHEGGTNAKGHVLKIGGRFTDFLSGQVTLFLSTKESNGTPRDKDGRNRLQVDLVWSF